ncbi:histone deacetylase domain protein [Burkholderia thailandensis E264]|uniref:Acetylpolyamine aminohydrolase n=1 Tax=Burkholderia thailandensis (strain ATCC 700388 / DSM 13276 / CCUG 48851 / CIP 106301 / E264) TaxID=271848 RepID=Q2SZZ9_BURTA|nr:histone deacetylase family protein [Burkholderia thailandensis]ABC36422.1 acetylpolyamine aminohydrolase [Burkholderia thailandensis E264]AHI71865.1 histone deacetylase domain protein [Burkholderia thailandensis 2002721723]AIP26603.1 histone deacetylase domain protein [Burkholderia thailandensis E264]AIS95877.1 histone deacetylase domain protein [Burkholderia thailandensis MSMB59]AJX97544.1 histone deacetylase domain protein [Burkholderia thailandensis 2002721643]
MLTYFHPDQSLHHPRTYFSRGRMRTPQEVPERAAQLVAAALAMGFSVREPDDFGIAPIAAVHDMSYLRFLETVHREWKKMPQDWGDEAMLNIFVRAPNALRGMLAQAARHLADGSRPAGEHTWRAAYGSAQSALAAAAVRDGAPEAYALCRSPGHHARADAAGGFCYLNNAAIAAQALRARHARVAILDADMHHGQGIQEIFYARRDVPYVSIHGDPTNFYPAVAGFDDERGSGDGYGYNVNLPMPHGSGEAAFFERADDALRELRRFAPDALVLSFGFGIYRDDPQSQVAVTTPGFGRLGNLIGALRLPTVIVQEGGYHIERLEANARSFFDGFGAMGA